MGSGSISSATVQGRPRRGPEVARVLAPCSRVCCHVGGLLAAGWALQEDAFCLETPMISVGRHPEPEKLRSEQEKEEASGDRSHCHSVLQRALNDCGQRGTQALVPPGAGMWLHASVSSSPSQCLGRGCRWTVLWERQTRLRGRWCTSPAFAGQHGLLVRLVAGSSVWGGLIPVRQLVLTRDPSWLGWAHGCGARTGPALIVFRGLEPPTHTFSAKGKVSSPGH